MGRFRLGFVEAALVCALVVSSAQAGPTAAPKRLEKLVVAESAPPKLDGDFDAAEWKGAAPFEVTRGKDVLGHGHILRSGRDLYLAYTSRLDPFGIGYRAVFRDPAGHRSVAVYIRPVDPPLSPLLIQRYPESDPSSAKSKSAAHCEVHFDFEAKQGFSLELRVPLDDLDIGRSQAAYGFRFEVWNLQSRRPVAGFPVTLRGPVAEPEAAPLVPAKDWGISAPQEDSPVCPALALLEQLNGFGASEATSKKDLDNIQRYTGDSDGKRNDQPLARFEARLQAALKTHPEFVSLRAQLVKVLVGRNDLEGALHCMEAMAKQFPPLEGNIYQVLIHARLLTDLQRYDEALAFVKAHEKVLSEAPEGRHMRAEILGLKEAWDKEKEIRKAEAKSDLPRVKLVTNKGDIVLELYEDDAPNAVADFISLVEKGFYDHTRFFWCAGGGRVEAGDPNTRDSDPFNDGFGGPGYSIESEPSRRMAFPFSVVLLDKRRTNRTEGSIFAIGITALTAIDGRNSVIGRVLQGKKVVLSLEYYDTIEKAVVVRKRDHKYVPVTR